MTTDKLGECWHSECRVRIHPDEVDAVLRQLDERGVAIKDFLPIAERYRRLFTNKFGYEPKKVLGGGAAAGTRKMRRAGKKRRYTKRRTV